MQKYLLRDTCRALVNTSDDIDPSVAVNISEPYA
jgi:hypothetical protein